MFGNRSLPTTACSNHAFLSTAPRISALPWLSAPLDHKKRNKCPRAIIQGNTIFILIRGFLDQSDSRELVKTKMICIKQPHFCWKAWSPNTQLLTVWKGFIGQHTVLSKYAKWKYLHFPSWTSSVGAQTSSALCRRAGSCLATSLSDERIATYKRALGYQAMFTLVAWALVPGLRHKMVPCSDTGYPRFKRIHFSAWVQDLDLLLGHSVRARILDCDLEKMVCSCYRSAIIVLGHQVWTWPQRHSLKHEYSL